MKNRLYNVGLVGAGYVTQSQLLALHALRDRLRPWAICDLSRDRMEMLTSRYCVPQMCDTVEQMLELENLDIIIISTPPSTHLELARKALESGKIVLCEKPIAHNLRDARELLELGKTYRGKLSIIHNYRYEKDWHACHAALASGLLGAIQSAHLHYQTFAGPHVFRNPWWGKWSVAGGGVVMTQFIHMLDMLCWNFGRPASVEAILDRKKQAIESEDSFSATLFYENGLCVECSSTMNADSQNLDFEVKTEGGTLTRPISQSSLESSVFEGIKQYLPKSPRKVSHSIPARIWRKGLRTLKLGGEVPRTHEPVSAHELYFRAVISALDHGETIPVPIEEAIDAMELCAAIYCAGMTGKRIDIPLADNSSFLNGITEADFNQFIKTKT